MKKKGVEIAIIGGGRIGTTVAKLLRSNGHSVRIWDASPKLRRGADSIEKAVSGVDFIFLCVSSWNLRSALRQIKKAVNKNQVFVSFTKGIERGTKKFAHEVIHSEFPRNDFAIVGGPFLAEELNRGHGGVGVVGTAKNSVFLKIKNLFLGTPARFIHSVDVRGIAIAGVLKNIYAVGLGVADGLMWGANAKGWLTAKFGEEMELMGEALGAKEKTMHRAAVADLIASGFSPYSRNHKTGEEILKRKKTYIMSESMASYLPLSQILGNRKKKYPYFYGLSQIVLMRKPVSPIFQKFLEK